MEEGQEGAGPASLRARPRGGRVAARVVGREQLSERGVRDGGVGAGRAGARLVPEVQVREQVLLQGEA